MFKVGANLGYHGPNARVFREWPAWEFTAAERAAHSVQPRTALYAGNLGYAHDRDALLAAAAELRADGFTVSMRGDGPGMRNLPSWVEGGRAFRGRDVPARSPPAG